MTRVGSTSGMLTLMRNLLAARQLTRTTTEQMSTGLRINRASDDPAGLIASEQLRSEIVALEGQMAGARRAIHRTATADGALGQAQSLLVEIRGALTTVANSGGMSDEEVAANQLLVDEAISSINRIAGGTEFNGEPLLDGTDGFSVFASDLGDAATGYLDTLVSGGTNDLAGGNFAEAAEVVVAAISQVSVQRGRLGAEQVSGLETQLRALENTRINVMEAESMIRDTDYAVTMAENVRAQILEEACLSVLAMAGRASAGGALDVLA